MPTPITVRVPREDGCEMTLLIPRRSVKSTVVQRPSALSLKKAADQRRDCLERALRSPRPVEAVCLAARNEWYVAQLAYLREAQRLCDSGSRRAILLGNDIRELEILSK